MRRSPFRSRSQGWRPCPGCGKPIYGPGPERCPSCIKQDKREAALAERVAARVVEMLAPLLENRTDES